MGNDSSIQGAEELNKALGANTVQFHTAYPLPDLKCTAAGQCSLPFPGAITSIDGTPNQKAERHANQIAYYHWVLPDTARAQQADEGLTPSHGPIWWRAINSLRITSAVLASRGESYAALESSVLDWILCYDVVWSATARGFQVSGYD